MKIWLDDERTPPDNDWKWCKTVPEAIVLMTRDDIELISLDHDLGEEGVLATGYDFVKWMAENNRWPKYSPLIHSANPVGRKNMQSVIDRYAPYGARNS